MGLYTDAIDSDGAACADYLIGTPKFLLCTTNRIEGGAERRNPSALEYIVREKAKGVNLASATARVEVTLQKGKTNW